MRYLVPALLAAGATSLSALSASSAELTRIETRPFYGAVITIEEGVRVFRALPPTRHVVVNPGGQTPLSLGINDTRITETSTSHNYFYDRSGRVVYPSGAGGFVGGFGLGANKFGHGRRFGGKKFGGRKFGPGRQGGRVGVGSVP